MRLKVVIIAFKENINITLTSLKFIKNNIHTIIIVKYLVENKINIFKMTIQL